MASGSPELQRAAGRRARRTAGPCVGHLRTRTTSRSTTCRAALQRGGEQAAAADARQQRHRTTCTGSGSRSAAQPYLVGGARMIGGGPTGYMFKSLDAERPGPQLAGLVAGDRHGSGADRLGAAGAGRRRRPCCGRCSGSATRPGGWARASSTPGCGCRAPTNWPSCRGRSTRRRRRCRAQVEELSAREAASRRFVADMSHELRTPLTAITAVTEVLEDEADIARPDDRARPCAWWSARPGGSNDLVENLMEVTRFDAGTARLRARRGRRRRPWSPPASTPGPGWTRWTWTRPRGILVRLDPRRLDVILANLIGNALKHGGSPVRVSVRDGGRRAGHRGRRQRPRHPRGRPAARLRPLLQGRRLPARVPRAAVSACRSPWRTRTSTAAPSPPPTRPEGGAVFTLRLPIPPGETDCPADQDDTDPGTAGHDGGGQL